MFEPRHSNSRWYTEPAGGQLRAAFNSSKSHIRIVAPYVKYDAAEWLLSDIPDHVTITVITTWSAADVAVGATDLEVFDLISSRRGSTLLLHPELHAKLYIIDWSTCLVGSANVTSAALGIGSHANVEILGSIAPVPRPLLRLAFALENDTLVASEELKNEMERLAESISIKESISSLSKRSEELARQTSHRNRRKLLLSSLPQLRHPDDLYRFYAGNITQTAPEVLACAEHDLGMFELQPALDHDSFQAIIREQLLQHPFMKSFDAFLQQPRWFGQMADWIRQTCIDVPTPDRKDIKAQVQVLIRWLRWFFPDTYRLEKPRHSECFGRADADWISIVL